jgi:hypothetical protein
MISEKYIAIRDLVIPSEVEGPLFSPFTFFTIDNRSPTSFHFLKNSKIE